MENKILNTYFHVKSVLYNEFDEMPKDLVENGRLACQLFPTFYKSFCKLLGDAVVSDRELTSYYITLASILNVNMEVMTNDI